MAIENDIRWHVTTQTSRWRQGGALALSETNGGPLRRSFDVLLDRPGQAIVGVGGSFSELGWDALMMLTPKAREQALALLFADDGAAFTIGRTPIGANDFARGWYSYDETPDDVALDDFSIDNDRATLIPFITAALTFRPDLTLWASPWSPPTWMKTNGHYALAPAWPGAADNGIRTDQCGAEDTDAFRLDDRHLAAYARYVRRYVEAYRDAGIRIAMVMPQNEFNSAQPFPSCTWTPEGLSRFVPVLAREMGAVGVEVFLGTLERARPELIDALLGDPDVAAAVKGIGVQWAGRDALPVIRAHHPDIAFWGTEQECGRGTNDWHYARYGWESLRQYFIHGASAWTYWNMVLPAERNVSTWGWPQNMLLGVGADGSVTPTHEYWVMRHLSTAARPGGRHLPTSSFVGFENQLAFRGADGSVALVLNNHLSDPMPLKIGLGSRELDVTLPPDSFSTIHLPVQKLTS